MQKFQKRYIILIGVLSLFVTLILMIQYRHPVERINVDLSKVPLNIGEWQGEEISVDEETKDILETESVLMRKYTRGNDSVDLAIVYYRDSRVAFHLPAGCYAGKGTYIVERGIEKINISESKNFYTNKLVIKGNKGNQVVLYYFETGDIRTNSYMTLRWNMMIDKLKSKRNDGAMIRFSAPIKDEPDGTLRILKQFINQIVPLLQKYLG